jgi:hypothetical protein
LILVDPDFFREYAPRQQIQLKVPHGYRVVLMDGIPKERIPLLLLRAKVRIECEWNIFVMILDIAC